MSLPFHSIDLGFSDFVLLAILQALLYGLTGMELALSPTESRVGTKQKMRKQAAGSALAGLLATIAAGLFAAAADGAVEPFLLLFPLSAIGYWAYLHGDSASLADMSFVKDALEQHYREVIISSLPREGSLSAREICATAIAKVDVSAVLARTVGLARLVAPVAAQEVLNDLLLTPKKVEMILESLPGQIVTSRQHDDGLRRYRATPELARATD